MVTTCRSFAVAAGTVVIAMAVAAPAIALLAKGGKGITCKLVKVKDTGRTGMVAFTYFVPKGWTSDASMTWKGQLPSTQLTAASADGNYSVERIEPDLLVYNAYGNKPPKGIKINHATDLLHALVNRMSDQGTFSNVEVLEEFNTTLPLTDQQKGFHASQVVRGMKTTQVHEAGFLKIKFIRNGNQETASFGTNLVGSDQSIEQTIGYGRTATHYNNEMQTNVVGPTIVASTPISPSASKVKEAAIISSSFRATPNFQLYCAKVALGMSQAALKATQERGRQQIAQMNHQRDVNMANFRQQMASKDANSREFCNYLLDQQDYHSPDGSLVTLPTAYDHSYGNSRGEYILNDDPTFDPRGYGSGGWKPLVKAHAND